MKWSAQHQYRVGLACDVVTASLLEEGGPHPSPGPLLTLLAFLAGIGPVLGLVSVPLLGSASDHWRGRYGRRRPFIWALSLGVLLSLFLIPRASRLAGLLCPDTRPLELALLILGVGLLAYCGQLCFTPLEALLSDLFRDPDHCRQAFSVYAFMIGLGGCLGYLLPAIDWDASALAPYLGTQEECLFGLLALIFLTCVAATAFVAEEAALGPAEPAEGLSAPSVPPCCPCRARLTLWSLGALCPRLRRLCCRMPRALRRLFMAELCSWMAFMTFTLFYTDFVGEGLYQGVPGAEPGTEARRHYDEGKAVAVPGGAAVGAALLGVRVWGDTHSLHIWAPISPYGKWASVQAVCAVAQEKSDRLAATSVEPQAVCKVLVSHCPNLVEGEAELISGLEAGPSSAWPHVLCALCSAAAVASLFQLRRPKLFLWSLWRAVWAPSWKLSAPSPYSVFLSPWPVAVITFPTLDSRCSGWVRGAGRGFGNSGSWAQAAVLLVPSALAPPRLMASPPPPQASGWAAWGCSCSVPSPCSSPWSWTGWCSGSAPGRSTWPAWWPSPWRPAPRACPAAWRW